MTEPLLVVRGLGREFRIGGGFAGMGARRLSAVADVDFDLAPGRTLGIVGESGSGKSTLARCLIRLIEPTSGSIHLDGEDVLALSGSRLKAFRRRVQMVFQDPYGSLNPRLTVGDALDEPLRVHRLGTSRQREARVVELLETVGLSADHRSRYPHEFSGGQRQRIGIARALAVRPQLLIADEPVSALDVSVQAQVLNLLVELQSTLGLSMIFIAHDLAVVEHVSDEILVMQSGRVVERGPAEELVSAPRETYTRSLLASVPRLLYGAQSRSPGAGFGTADGSDGADGDITG
jgi:oligopeptide transport system ATP-binding protein